MPFPAALVVPVFPVPFPPASPVAGPVPAQRTGAALAVPFPAVDHSPESPASPVAGPVPAQRTGGGAVDPVALVDSEEKAQAAWALACRRRTVQGQGVQWAS